MYIETNILSSDVIVRARHISAEAHITAETSRDVYHAEMRHEFEVLEYLKGNGGNKVWGVVSLPKYHRVSSSEQEARSKLTYYMNVRNTQWDGKEAIVFLSEIENAPSGLRSDHYSLGQFLSDYHLESYLPSTYGGWYPAISAQGGASGAGASQPGFLLRGQENVSLGDWLAYDDPDYSVLSAAAVSGQSGDVTLSLEEIKTLVGMTEAKLQERELSLYGLMIVVESPDNAIPPATRIEILTASSKPGGILLIWQTSATESEVEGYRILRRKQTDSEFIELANIPITEEGYYQDMRDIQPETKYIYRLRAYGASGDIADARIAITTVAALEPLSGPAATATSTASPTPTQPTATVVPTAATPAAVAPTPTPYPERTLPINLTQTIGGFTVELTAIEDTADGIEVKQSYQTNISEKNYLQIGSPEIRYSNGVTESEFDAYLPAPGEEVDISLGSFIVADTSLTGAVDIPLSSRAENGDLSPQPELLVGSKRYAVTSLGFETIQGFEGMRVIVDTKPLNRAAEYGMLGIVAFSSAHATLTDGDGGVYDVLFGRTKFAPFNQALTGQSLMFESAERKRFSSGEILTLSIRGAGNIVGPFVFENVHVVSETAPVETPQVPGGPGAGEATTTPVSAIDPTATPGS